MMYECTVNHTDDGGWVSNHTHHMIDDSIVFCVVEQSTIAENTSRMLRQHVARQAMTADAYRSMRYSY